MRDGRGRDWRLALDWGGHRKWWREQRETRLSVREEPSHEEEFSLWLRRELSNDSHQVSYMGSLADVFYAHAIGMAFRSLRPPPFLVID